LRIAIRFSAELLSSLLYWTYSSLYIQAQSPPPPPTVIKLGDSNVDGSFLKPYKNAWKVVYAFPGKEPFLLGTWTDELAGVEINGRHWLKRSQMADYAK
jgi:hypothetical protein